VGADDRGATHDPSGAGSRTPRNPWVRRSRRTAYRTAWIEVFHDEVGRPDGSDGIYGVVHFHERAVGVVAVGTDGRILLVGQHRYTLDRYSWEIPEGGVPIDEDPLARPDAFSSPPGSGRDRPTPSRARRSSCDGSPSKRLSR
jgi:8-oxo-dGTP pyrophosphatase MutT (NUDIX family)